jgi:site-specific DNA-methyltransferase (adenine-specific)
MTHLDDSKVKEKARSRTQKYGKGYYDKINQGDLTPEEKREAKEALEEAREKVQSGEITGFRMKIRGVHALPYGGRGGRMTHLENKGYSVIELTGSVMKKDVIECSVENTLDWNDEHPAIYPEYIIKELLGLLTQEEDLVLDPFVGSGTTAAVCAVMNRDYYGIDLNEEYCERAEQRVEKALLGTLPEEIDVENLTDDERQILLEMLKNPDATQEGIAENIGKSDSYICQKVMSIDGIEWGDQLYLLNGNISNETSDMSDEERDPASLDRFDSSTK